MQNLRQFTTPVQIRYIKMSIQLRITALKNKKNKHASGTKKHR